MAISNSVLNQIKKRNAFNLKFKKEIAKGSSARTLMRYSRELGVSISPTSLNKYLSVGLTARQLSTYFETRSRVYPRFKLPTDFVLNTNRERQISVFRYQLRNSETRVKSWKSIHVESDYHDTYENILQQAYADIDEVLEISNSTRQTVTRIDYDSYSSIINQRQF